MKATDAIPGLQQPTNATEPKSFTGICSVFRRFVPNCIRIAALLNRKLEKNRRFRFGRLNETQIEGLEMLQHRLLSPQKLALIRTNESHVLAIGACGQHVGLVLL